MAKVMAFVGCGNMGGAILRGFSGKLPAKDWNFHVCDHSEEKMASVRSQTVKTFTSIKDAVDGADIVVLAVKPAQIPGVLQEAASSIKDDAIVCSIAAGVSLISMRNILGPDCRIARCMPTTTSLVGRGIFAFCFDELNFPRDLQEYFLKLFSLLGYCQEIPETKFTAYSALIGAGPAYVFEMMQGLAQAALTLGFSGAQSRPMLEELFAGCAELARQRQEPLMVLRDEVCSPGGLTIAGINVLDRAGFTGLVVDAVLEANRRGKEMEKE